MTNGNIILLADSKKKGALVCTEGALMGLRLRASWRT
jgi:hypothetical protein